MRDLDHFDDIENIEEIEEVDYIEMDEINVDEFEVNDIDIDQFEDLDFPQVGDQDLESLEDLKHIRFDNCAYEQGMTIFEDYQGTCGPTSVSNVFNLLNESYDCSEQSVLFKAISKNLCTTEAMSPEERGGTSTENLVNLIEEISEATETDVVTEIYENENALNADELAELLDDPDTLAIVAVKADVLWGREDQVSFMESTDHWITVESPYYNEDGELEGFHIIDSGGGMDYVDKETLDKALVGDDEVMILEPVSILIKKEKEVDE